MADGERWDECLLTIREARDNIVDEQTLATIPWSVPGPTREIGKVFGNLFARSTAIEKSCERQRCLDYGNLHETGFDLETIL